MILRIGVKGSTMKSLNDVIEKMEREIDTDNFIETMDHCIQEIEESGVGIRAAEPLLEFMERHPFADFGVPGSIVHFLETFYKKGYEEILLRSVKRRPTIHTIWMLNRVKNGAQEQQKYMNILKEIVENKKIEKEIRETAEEFLD